MADDDDLLTMPFVLTEEHGGIYRTEDFVAGWHLGILDARLTLAVTADLIAPPVVLRMKWKEQADLIAMAHGLATRVLPMKEDPEYGYFSFLPPEMIADSPE